MDSIGIRSDIRRATVTLLCLLTLLGCMFAQQVNSVPSLVKFSGTLEKASSGTVSAVFALYKDQTGGAALWQETQSIAIDANGHYTVYLGAHSQQGIPAAIFSSNEARWLGIAIQGQPAQARVLLVSVPYAIKAADAETLGGLPASAFLRASAEPAYVNGAAVTAAAANIAPMSITATGAKAGYLPVFTDASGDMADSVIAQAGGKVGIGTTAPAATLDLVGTSPTIRVANISATVGSVPTLSFVGARGTPAAMAPTKANDYLGVLGGSGYNGTALTSQRARIVFAASENWTSKANGASISLQTTASGTTTMAERMHISSNGNVGIGIPAPTSLLSVAGTIQSTKGGFKFPDNTVQTSAAATAGTGLTLASNKLAVSFAGTGTANTAAHSDHNHDATYLKLSGGVLTAGLTVSGTVKATTFTGDGAGLTGLNATISATSPLFGNGSAATPLFLSTAGPASSGYVTMSDWNAFNNKLAVNGDGSSLTNVNAASLGGVAANGYATLWGVNTFHNNNIFVTDQIFQGWIDAFGDIKVDDGNANAGMSNNVFSPALRFGGGNTGEGIASTRVSGKSNLNGLDFYTAYNSRMSITNTGGVGIGTATPATQLEVDGPKSNPTYGAIYANVGGASTTSTGQVGRAAIHGDLGTHLFGSGAVMGTADDNRGGYFENNSAGLATLKLTNNYSPASDSVPVLVAIGTGGSCDILGNGNLTCSGKVTGAIKVNGGNNTVALYAMQSPENWFEDFGTGTLGNGEAVVDIDPVFAQTVNTAADYHVFLTPRGDCKGLYVAQTSSGSFVVRELGGGHSNISFDYRIVAKRAGMEQLRMEDLTERMKLPEYGVAKKQPDVKK